MIQASVRTHGYTVHTLGTPSDLYRCLCGFHAAFIIRHATCRPTRPSQRIAFGLALIGQTADHVGYAELHAVMLYPTYICRPIITSPQPRH
eukprot:54706-Eustigmatos_ZCMA.PRE.1